MDIEKLLFQPEGMEITNDTQWVKLSQLNKLCLCAIYAIYTQNYDR